MQTKTTAKDFFFHLAGFAGLYVSAISLISLLFAIVNRALPDALNSYYYGIDPYSGGMRAAIASLIIVFPIYLFIAWRLDRYLRANPEKKDVAVRKWLSYLTLFVTGAAVVVDLVVLVNTFLGGEITSRFVLKVAAVIIVAGAVFWYYLYDLRKTFDPSTRSHSALIMGLAAALVLGSLVTGFVIVGSPTRARDMKFDERRVNDLTSIQWQVVSYWQQKATVPSTTAALNDTISGFSAPVDPQTGKAYIYEKTGARSFKLCADFSRASASKASPTRLPTMSATSPDNSNWSHGAGTVCFDRTIDPDMYPVREAAPVKGY